MSDKSSDPERAKVKALVLHMLARSEEHGIAKYDFYLALVEEQRLHPDVPVAELLERTLRRVLATLN